jgi:hypothetical protein
MPKAGANGLRLARARLRRAKGSYQLLLSVLPAIRAKYQDQIAAWKAKWAITEFPELEGEIVPIELQVLLQESESIDPAAAPRHPIKERDEFAALEAAAADILALERYQNRTWARQKRAILNFMKLKHTPRSFHQTPSVLA